MNAPYDPVKPPAPQRPRTPLARQIKRGLWALGLILVLIFVVQNAPAVQLRYLVWRFSFSLAILVIIVLLVGMLLGWGLTAFVRRRPRR